MITLQKVKKKTVFHCPSYSRTGLTHLKHVNCLNDQLQRHKKPTSYMYLDLNGSANSLTHDLPFTN